MLEVAPEDLEWRDGRWSVERRPVASARRSREHRARRARPDRPSRRASSPASTPRPSTTRRTSRSRSAPTSAWSTSTRAPRSVKVRRFIAVDDCGVRINPMIVEGQIHGGLTDGVGMALMETIAFDEDGNCLAGSLMDYLIPTAVEVPDWETDFDGHAVAAPPDRGQGRRRVRDRRLAAGDRQRDLRRAAASRHVDMPCTPSRVWEAHDTMIRAIPSSGCERLLAERVPFVDRDRRARGQADQRAARRLRARARRRHDRGLRRRRLRAGVRAPVRRARAGDRRGDAAAPAARACADDRARPARRRRSSPTTPA